jgi:hypothetical protein
MTPAAVKVFECEATRNAMARREALALDEVGAPERQLEDDAVLVRDGHQAARLLGGPHLELQPARDVVERSLQPFLHRGGPPCPVDVAH